MLCQGIFAGRFFSFNLTLEILFVDRGLAPRPHGAHCSFNLMIEILFVDRAITAPLAVDYFSFNLMIEILFVDREGTRRTVTVTDLWVFQSHD